MEELYRDNVWQIQRETAVLKNGKEITVTRAHRPNGVCVLPIEADGNIIILKEHRPYYNADIYMLPSGTIDKEGSPEEAARRELQEEAGYYPHKLTLLTETRASEKIEYVNYLYLASDLEEKSLDPDPEEYIEVYHMDPEKALEHVLESPVVHSPSALNLLLYLQNQKQQ